LTFDIWQAVHRFHISETEESVEPVPSLSADMWQLWASCAH